jgi:putative transposase
MQALERAAADLPLAPGHARRRECNYIRHGTSTLIAGLNVGDGQVYAHVGPTRTEVDFANFITDLIEEQPKKEKFVFILDQLNTHKSETLVRLAARLNGDKQELGTKGSKGILESMPTRMAYLEGEREVGKDQLCKVRFVFTPKHCSWLNVVEGWFSGLHRRVLQTGSFTSLIELVDKVISYANYYNKHLAKGINWEKSTKKKIRQLIKRTKRLVMKLTG